MIDAIWELYVFWMPLGGHGTAHRNEQYIYIYIYIHTYIHKYIHTFIHTYTHIYMYKGVTSADSIASGKDPNFICLLIRYEVGFKGTCWASLINFPPYTVTFLEFIFNHHHHHFRVSNYDVGIKCSNDRLNIKMSSYQYRDPHISKDRLCVETVPWCYIFRMSFSIQRTGEILWWLLWIVIFVE